MKLSPKQIAQARQWRAAGRNYKWMGQHFGCDPDTVQRACDPNWRARRNQKIAEAKAYRRGNLADDGSRNVRPNIPPEVKADRERRRNLSLTPNQYILGDPVPGRSALDMKCRTTGLTDCAVQ